MTSQPEKLFRDKLEQYQKPAPVAAWDRIESELEKANPKRLWLKIAAGLLLLSVAAFLLWPNILGTKSESLTKANKLDLKKESLLNTEAVVPSAHTPLLTVRPKTTKRTATPVKKIKQIQENDSQLLATSNKVNSHNENLSTNTDKIEVRVVPINPTSTIASNTIVYTANDMDTRFLKKDSPIEATSEEKKTSGIQKLMGLAYDLKNNDTAFGDLRQKKNEILALNFRENKRGQNK